MSKLITEIEYFGEFADFLNVFKNIFLPDEKILEIVYDELVQEMNIDAYGEEHYHECLMNYTDERIVKMYEIAALQNTIGYGRYDNVFNEGGIRRIYNYKRNKIIENLDNSEDDSGDGSGHGPSMSMDDFKVAARALKKMCPHVDF